MQHDVLCLVVAVPGGPASQKAHGRTWSQWKTEVKGKKKRQELQLRFIVDMNQTDGTYKTHISMQTFPVDS